ncbi:MAG: STAS domain-containing protein [Pelosinus sp.]|nr:STAS domain-containing protein [Pelosinus sp.]
MKVSVEQNDDIKIIALDGQLDVSTSEQAKEEVLSLFEVKPTIIFMEKCSYVSSSGLRSLLIMAKTAKAKGIKLVFAAPIAEVIDVFEMTGFIKMLTCVPTIEDAKQALR